MKFERTSVLATLLCASSLASAQLVDTRTDSNPLTTNVVLDGAIGANEYGAGNSQVYSGSGGGFGGTLGNGAIYMDFDATNLYIAVQPGANLNDNVVMLFDTRSGGFTDAMMNDTGDPGRNLSSNLTRDSNDNFPTGFLADFSLVVGPFGMVTFELTNGSLNFLQYEGAFIGNSASLVREICIPRASFALGDEFCFFAGYGSDTNYMSDEAIPGQTFSGGGNLGFGGAGDVEWSRYDKFQAVPEPATMAAVSLGVAALIRRRRKSN